VGDTPFPVKYSPKVTHPLFEERQLRQISADNVSTVRDSEKINYHEYEIDRGLSNEL